MAEILHFEILRKHGQTNTHTNKQTHTQTNTQTNRHGHYNTSPSPYGGRGNYMSYVYQWVCSWGMCYVRHTSLRWLHVALLFYISRSAIAVIAPCSIINADFNAYLIWIFLFNPLHIHYYACNASIGSMACHSC